MFQRERQVSSNRATKKQHFQGFQSTPSHLLFFPLSTELISQRRRWLNGSFAASIYSLVHFFRIYKSNHGIIRLFFFHLQALYNVFTLVFTWFALANLWLTFSIIINFLPDSLLVNSSDGVKIALHWLNLGCKWVYVFFLVLQFVLALGNRPKGEKATYIASFIVFGLLGLYLIGASLALTVKALLNTPKVDGGGFFKTLLTSETSVLIASLTATFGIYIIASLLYADPWHMMTSFPQYVSVKEERPERFTGPEPLTALLLLVLFSRC